MRRILFTLLYPITLSAQRDTTIYTATRIRTAANGAITSVSVTKIATPAKTDTVRIAGPRDSIAFYPRVVPNPWHFTFDLVNWTGAGTKPADVAFPTLPTPPAVHDTVIQVRVDTVRVPTGPAPDSIQVVHVDNHVFLYSGGGVPAGNGVYLESSSYYLGSVNPTPTGWQAWKYIRVTVDPLGYPHTTPPRLLGIYPTQDAAAMALYTTTGAMIPCGDPSLGPFVDDGYPSTYLDQSAFTACGTFLGRILSSDGLYWLAAPWHAAYPAKRFASNRQALLYLVGQNTEQPLP